MTSRAIRLLLVSLLLPLAAALAKDPPPEQVGRASADQQAWAADLAQRVGLKLGVVQAVKQPGRPASTRVAQGTRVKLGRMSVEQLRFADAAQAQAWAGKDPRSRRVHEGDPRWVVWIPSITFRDFSGELPEWEEDVVPRKLEQAAAAWAPGAEPPADLGPLLEAGDERGRAPAEMKETDRGHPAWEGPRVELDGLRLERRRYADEKTADEALSRHTHSETTRTVGDLRGVELIVLRGEGAADPHAAARVLKAAWQGGAAPSERLAVGVLAPTQEPGADEEVAAACLRPRGEIYAAGGNLLRMAREKGGDEHLEGSIRWRFLDPGVRNHVLVRTKDTLFSEARVTETSMLFVLGKTQEGHKREKEYLLALLAGLDDPLPAPAGNFVELLDQGGR